jgi:hypothetical protein
VETVQRKWVGPPGPTSERPPEPKPKRPYRPDPAWDKLLLVLGAIVLVIAVLVVPGIVNHRGQNPVAAAAEATSNVPGARSNFTLTVSGPVQMTLTGKGLMNGETKRATVELAASGSTAAGTRGFSLNEVIADGNLYFHSPELNGAFGTSTQWLLVRGEVFGDLLGGSSSGAGAGMSASPTQQLDALKAASDQVTAVGHQRLDGVDTTHYTAIVDTGKVADELKSHVSGDLGDVIERAAEQVQSESVDVWVDDQGLIRRVTSAMTMADLGNVNMTIDFMDYGIHPNIQVPPASEVYDITPIMQRALDQFNS